MEANNIKEMREALERFADVPDEDLCELEKHAHEMQDHCVYGGGALEGIILRVRAAKNALSAPPRNCDVGADIEQAKRFWRFCNEKTCEECPLPSIKGGACELFWGQLPYEPAMNKTTGDYHE